jgi:hypothetical protein
MKKLIFCLILLSHLGCDQKKVIFNDYIASIKTFQDDLNYEYSIENTSPLIKEDLKKFKSLDFFPIDSSYRVVASFIRTPNELPFEMTTTTSRKSIEVKYGEIHFKLHAKPYKLNVYQNQELILTKNYKNYLFLPFTDLTNGDESYGGGRYIDLEIPIDNTMIIDFNKAYNPYCAYNHKYSCPIPPRENDLGVKIKAGVMAFKK